VADQWEQYATSTTANPQLPPNTSGTESAIPVESTKQPKSLPPKTTDKWAQYADTAPSKPVENQEVAPATPSKDKWAIYADKPSDKTGVEKPQVAETATHKNQQKGTTGETISAAPRHFYDPIVQAFTGPGTAYGAAQAKRTGARIDTAPGKPLIDFQALHGHEPEAKSTAGKVVQQIVGGAEEFASGLTTPQNVLTLLGTHGLSGAIPLASKLIALGFSYKMLKSAFEEAPVATEKLKKGDIPGFAREMTKIGLTTALGTKLAMHGAESAEQATKPAGRAESKPGSLTTSAAPAAAGGETAGAPRVDFRETPVVKDSLTTQGGSVHGPVTYGFGLGALGEFDLSTPESEALAAQRKATLAALEKAKATPEQTDLAARLRAQLTGVREFLRTWINQKMLSLKAKTLKDHVDREALTLLRDFKDKPGELQQFLDGTHPWLSNQAITARLLEDKPDATPEDIRKATVMVVQAMAKMKPVIERALNPTPAMLKADPILTDIARQFLAAGKAKGILDSSITPEAYAPHMINPGDGLAGDGEVDPASYRPINERGKLVAGKIARKFGFAKQRQYPTMLHAIADGLQPRTLDIIDAFTIYGDKFANAFATRDWEETVADTGLGLWTTRDKAPAGWRPIAEHSPLFMKRATFPIRGEDTTETKHATVEYRFYVPPYIEEAMRPITDPDFTSRLMGFTKLRAYQAFTKTANLAWSLFHPKALTIMAYNSMGPRDFIRGLRIDRNSDYFKAGQRQMALDGGVPLGDVNSRTFEAYRALKPSSIPTQVDIWRAKKGLREADKLAEGFTTFTFDTVGGKFKVVDYLLKKRAFEATHPNATTAELRTYMRGVTQYLNNVYGGINWENRGWNRASVNYMRAIIMAPDWTYSNIFGIRDAFFDWKNWRASSSRLSRAFWMKAVANGIAATIMTSILLQGHKFYQVVDSDKKLMLRALTEVYMGDDAQGNHIFRPIFFAGAQSDLINTITKMATDGPAIGLAEEMRNKITPGLRTAPTLMTNKTYVGSEISDREEPWLTQARRQAGFAIGDTLPVPFWVLTAKDMLFGTDSSKYSAAEVAETMLLASPSHHVRPTGTPEEEAKRKAKAAAGHFVQSPEGAEESRRNKEWIRRLKAGDESVWGEIDRWIAEAGSDSKEYKRRSAKSRAIKKVADKP
jgi:hypothetical protein